MRKRNNINILLVSDSPSLSNEISFYLKKTGFECSITITTESANAIIEKKTPDLVICEDYLLSGIKRSDNYMIITITEPDGLAISKAYYTGAFAYLIRPVQHDVMMRRVLKVLAHRGLWQRPELFVSFLSEDLVLLSGRMKLECEKKNNLLAEISGKNEQMLAQVRQLQKMSSLGQLLSCVAHELNNPLTSIIGFSQVLQEENIPEGLKKDIKIISDNALICKNVVANILAVARKSNIQKKEVDLNLLIEQIIELKDYDFKINNIGVKKNLDKILMPLYADAGGIIQILLNLFNNSVDALTGKGGGEITVETQKTKDGVVMRVFDNGAGFGDCSKVFDPFYTTKAEGKGTGLGLFVCRDIVDEHGGRISAANNTEGGAKIEIFLPETKPQTVSSFLKVKKQPVESKNILIVDDEENILAICKKVLERRKHYVATASKAEELKNKLELMKYDAVIMDVRMPGQNGLEIYSMIMKNYPYLAGKVIMMSGDTSADYVTKFISENGLMIIFKPFDIGEFEQIVNEILLAP